MYRIERHCMSLVGQNPCHERLPCPVHGFSNESLEHKLERERDESRDALIQSNEKLEEMGERLHAAMSNILYLEHELRLSRDETFTLKNKLDLANQTINILDIDLKHIDLKILSKSI